MDQINLGLDPLPKKTRKEVFLEEMNQVVPWSTLVALIQPHARGAHQALGGRPPFAVETMLRIHCLQLWWNLSDPAMEEELHERPLYRRFVGLDGSARMPDETTILRFRHLLEKQQLAPKVLAAINATLARQGLMLKTGTVVDATIIAAPSSTKNAEGKRKWPCVLASGAGSIQRGSSTGFGRRPRSSRPASGPRSSIRSGWSSSSSATPRCATAAWPRTRPA